MPPHAASITHPQGRGENPHEHLGRAMGNIKAELVQHRWKEIVRDLSEQNGINPIALLKKMPAFAGNDFDEYSLDFEDVSGTERQILRAAADTMAELILAMVGA